MVQPGTQHAHKHYKIHISLVKNDKMNNIGDQQLPGAHGVVKPGEIIVGQGSGGTEITGF